MYGVATRLVHFNTIVEGRGGCDTQVKSHMSMRGTTCGIYMVSVNLRDVFLEAFTIICGFFFIR